MEIIKWANGKGQRLILSEGEAEELAEAIRKAYRSTHLPSGRAGQGECGRFEVEIEQ